MKNFLTLVTGAALPNGGEVGTVESVAGGAVVLDTGKNKAALSPEAFAKAENGLSITMTKLDLDTAVEKAAADAKAQLLAGLTPGTEVKSVTGHE